MIHKKSTALEWSVNILLEGLKARLGPDQFA